MLRFLVDGSTGQAVAELLRRLDYDAVVVSEFMPQADDEDIIQHAYAEQRILISNDKDFGDKVYRDGRHHAGIILLRLTDDRAATKVQVIEALLQEHSERLTGNFVVASERNVRIRR